MSEIPNIDIPLGIPSVEPSSSGGSIASSSQHNAASEETPSSLTDLEGWICQRKLHQSIKCPKTGLRVSFAELGDPKGVPLLYCLPSGNSRYIAFPLDGVMNANGVRLIAVDRPGAGGTPQVPLLERIATSCVLMESVLEHLRITTLTGVLVSSGGIFYALHLALHHAHLFPPKRPHLYMMVPWYPSRNPFSQPLNLVPTGLIQASDKALPYLEPVIARLDSGVGKLSKVFSSISSPSSTDVKKEAKEAEVQDVSTGYFPPYQLWPVMHRYMIAEDLFSGTRDEYMHCLSRGGLNVGQEWYKQMLQAIAAQLTTDENNGPLRIHVWWGGKDGMIPKAARDAFNKLLTSFPDKIITTIHDNYPHCDHNNMLSNKRAMRELMNILKTTAEVSEIERKEFV